MVFTHHMDVVFALMGGDMRCDWGVLLIQRKVCAVAIIIAGIRQ